MFVDVNRLLIKLLCNVLFRCDYSNSLLNKSFKLKRMKRSRKKQIPKILLKYLKFIHTIYKTLIIISCTSFFFLKLITVKHFCISLCHHCLLNSILLLLLAVKMILINVEVFVGSTCMSRFAFAVCAGPDPTRSYRQLSHKAAHPDCRQN